MVDYGPVTTVDVNYYGGMFSVDVFLDDDPEPHSMLMDQSETIDFVAGYAAIEDPVIRAFDDYSLGVFEREGIAAEDHS